MASGEQSQRVFDLTTDVIEYNPANYTVRCCAATRTAHTRACQSAPTMRRDAGRPANSPAGQQTHPPAGRQPNRQLRGHAQPRVQTTATGPSTGTLIARCHPLPHFVPCRAVPCRAVPCVAAPGAVGICAERYGDSAGTWSTRSGSILPKSFATSGTRSDLVLLPSTCHPSTTLILP